MASAHEASLLRLDCSKARALLGWKPVWDTDTNFDKTISWYKAFYEQKLVLTTENIKEYIQQAKHKTALLGSGVKYGSDTKDDIPE